MLIISHDGIFPEMFALVQVLKEIKIDIVIFLLNKLIYFFQVH